MITANHENETQARAGTGIAAGNRIADGALEASLYVGGTLTGLIGIFSFATLIAGLVEAGGLFELGRAWMTAIGF